MMQHTPGPWMVHDVGESSGVTVCTTDCVLTEGHRSHSGLVALVYGVHINHEYTLEATRRLIAAAPGMLDLLQAMLDHHGEEMVSGELTECRCPACKGARALLASLSEAKATR